MIVLETSALVAIVAAEPGHDRLLDRIAEAEVVILPPHCLLEAHMVIAGRFEPEMLATLDAVVEGIGPRIEPFTAAHAQVARAAFLAYGKGRHPAGLNFGDCMSYAVAKAEGLPLLFTGADFARTDLAGA